MAKQKLTFEDTLAKLEKIVSEIEEGRVSLDESIEKYTEGTKLIAACRSILDKAEKKIQVLTQGENESLKSSDSPDEDQEN